MDSTLLQVRAIPGKGNTLDLLLVEVPGYHDIQHMPLNLFSIISNSEPCGSERIVSNAIF